MQNKTLIILGMHRSGTSLITQWLNRCGLEIGERLVGANAGNKDGHFEDVEFLKLHEDILENNGLDSTGLIDSQKITLSFYDMARLKSILNVKQRLYKQWSWKDPRTCLLLDTYTQLLPNAKYLVITRDFQSVISSLLKREFAQTDKKYMSRKYLSRLVWQYFRRARKLRNYHAYRAEMFLKVWINYSEEILRALKKLPTEDYLVLNYTMLFKQDSQVIDFLKQEWQFDLTHIDFKSVYKNNLMSAGKDDIEAFITDKTLLLKAAYLQQRLQDYVKTNLLPLPKQAVAV